jgi:septum site-determining protein MinC
MSQSDLFDTRPVFQLKGSMLAATVLELGANHLPRLQQQLAGKVLQAPQLFRGSPLILGLDRLGEADGVLDLAALLDICRSQGLQPVGVRASRAEDIAAAEALGLPVLPAGRGRDRVPDPEPPEPEPASGAEPEPAVTGAGSTATADTLPAEPAVSRPGRIITQPVRSGQQIYAEGADLIVLAPVSAGAEIIADGHIHCYGVLRGRALAGVKGDSAARLFCQHMEAELVSVAGRYKIAEDLRRHPLWGKGVQACLDNDELSLNAL